MAERELSYSITTDASKATAGIKQFGTAVKKELKATQDELDDTRTAGQKVADALKAMGDKIEAELLGTVQAADALKTALGETAQKLDVNDVVSDLRKLGLTFDDITADADQLADAIKRIDDVKVTGENIRKAGEEAGGAADNVKRLGGESDQTRSVLANLTGNTAQDLGALGGAAGSAGVAIGQLAEYAADGNISLGGLVKLAGPMALLAGAGALVSEAVAGIKLEKEFNAKRVEEITTALRETGTAANYLRSQFEETGKIEFVFDKGGFPGVGKEVRDITGDLGDLGISWQQFDDAVGSNNVVPFLSSLRGLADISGASDDSILRISQAVGKYRQQLDAATEATLVYNRINTETGESAAAAARAFQDAQNPTANFTEQLTTLGEGLRSGATDSPVFAKALEIVSEGMGITTAQALALAQAQLDQADASKKAADATQDWAQINEDAAAAAARSAPSIDEIAAAAAAARDEFVGLFNAQSQYADGQLDLQEAGDNLAQTTLDYADAIKDAKGDQIEINKINRESVQSAKDYAAAQVIATGKTLDSTEGQEAYRTSLIDTVNQLNGPQKQALTDYVADLYKIPPERVTAILANPDEPTLNAAEAQLADLARERQAKIKVDLILGNVSAGIQAVINQIAGNHAVVPTSSSAPIAPVAVGATSAAAPATSAAIGFPITVPVSPAIVDNRTINVTVSTKATGRELTNELDRWARINGTG